jgi:hypothetical protein
MYQQGAQVSIAMFADTQQAVFATTTVLSRR